MSEHTPLIQQYLDIKARHPEALLFFRVGDFYEMFFDDAAEGSRLLGLTLTSRNNGGRGNVPLAGIPVKAVDEYLPRLLRSGRRVAICEQVEDAAEADGLVRREVVETITPGTVLEDGLLTADRNNFIVVLAGHDPVGVATADLSTGEFELWSVQAGELADQLARLEPAELVVAEGEERGAPAGPWAVSRLAAWRFEPAMADEALRDQFGVAGTEGFGFRAEDEPHLAAAAGALVAYLREVRPAGVEHLRPPRVERAGRYMHLDEMTRRNLELVSPLRSEGGGTLLEVLDRTRTAMGGRLLRRRVLHPLLDLDGIHCRQAGVAELVEADDRRRALRSALAEVRDLERLAAKIATARAAPRELLALVGSLDVLPAVVAGLEGTSSAVLRDLAAGFDPLDDVADAIRRAIDPEAPATLKDGGVIRRGFSEELDALRGTRDHAVDFIADLQARERERTGISSLKVGYNKVFGYYLEVTRTHLDRVPDDYHRKQTLTNAERYFTPELKEWEEKVVGAEEAIASLESELYGEVRAALAEEVGRLQAAADRVARTDVLASLAEVAVREGYVRPEVDDGYRLEIRGGRHPVVERMMAREAFIPNDVVLDRGTRVMVLTGPNMSGKSTVLRQVGLIALLAQIGAYVPADRARIGLCDRIFTRVGASDNLVRGQSTFMVEMTETATILNGATDRSLVLLDEIGRGTSTYDGVSIAWAVTEYIHDVVEARTIFATHYHELVELADRLEGVGAFNVAVRETGDDIVFLRRVEPGGSDRSYGVHVGRLAGLPAPVVERAAEVLRVLEGGESGAGTRLASLVNEGRPQLSLFEPEAAAGEVPAVDEEDGPEEGSGPRVSAVDVLQRLTDLDPNRTTPLEALQALTELRRLAGLEEPRAADAPPRRPLPGGEP
ncbi:MAG: DNA mismatch repair protein MutS [Candidatus Palauibacterales bacterium]|nr:DNA mismatch repair protein MutS [Candidatus Palauibacterales bacterium]